MSTFHDSEVRTDKKFLTGIISSKWTEDVYEADSYWACYVRGEMLHEEDWQYLTQKIKEEFKENLNEIYSYTSNGVHFVIYLKKS